LIGTIFASVELVTGRFCSRESLVSHPYQHFQTPESIPINPEGKYWSWTSLKHGAQHLA